MRSNYRNPASVWCLQERERIASAVTCCGRYVTQEKGHGREETRIYIQMPAPKSLPGLGLWKCLKTIGVVVSLCVRDHRDALLHQQSGDERETLCPRRAWSLGH